MSNKKKKKPTNLDLMRSIRKDWNGVNPVSRTVESKKNKKSKHKKKELEEANET